MKKILINSVLGLAIAGLSSCASEKAFNQSMDKFLANSEQVEKISSALERHLREKQEKQQEQYAEAQQKRYEEQLNNPVKVDIGSSPVRGNKDAKVTIVEFSDFQCPYCQRGAQIMDQVLKAYPNDVKVVFKNFPLSFHQQALPAAIAALAAGKQGKFWEMHDLIFENQAALSDKAFEDFAKKIGISLDKFKKDYKDSKLKEAVEADINYGSQLGVGGTPGFYVNGVFVSGAQPFENFKQLIDRSLTK